jgi:hypothetical protein
MRRVVSSLFAAGVIAGGLALVSASPAAAATGLTGAVSIPQDSPDSVRITNRDF